MKKKAFRAALPYSLPICIGFLFIAMSYGFLMRSRGFSVFYPMAMSAFIFAGSMEFVAVELLLSAYAPLHAFLLTLMVNARHLFYGISMLEKYKGMGWKKPYLIFGMCDETFSINCTVTPPEGVDRGWFMFFVTLLNQTYWVAGATLGAAARAARTMGYRKIITYILDTESGASLRAVGWQCAGLAGGKMWTGKRRPAEPLYPPQMKYRYEKDLSKR